MSTLQWAFIAFTFLSPPLLWLLSRKVQSPRLSHAISCAFATALFASYAAAVALKYHADGAFLLRESLPMHLCDWAAVATILALVRRGPIAFELAYCWGLAGTVQALFTPAIAIEMNWRVITFLLVHSIIPASVFWLMFEMKLRPRPAAFWRVMIWSEVYLAAALLTNALTKQNYGFLSERPTRSSLLDYFSDTWWIYVCQVNATAAVAFGLLLLPWTVLRRRAAYKYHTSAGDGTGDA